MHPEVSAGHIDRQQAKFGGARRGSPGANALSLIVYCFGFQEHGAVQRFDPQPGPGLYLACGWLVTENIAVTAAAQQ